MAGLTPAWGHTEVERAREQVPGRGRSRPRELDREDVRNPPRERGERLDRQMDRTGYIRE